MIKVLRIIKDNPTAAKETFTYLKLCHKLMSEFT